MGIPYPNRTRGEPVHSTGWLEPVRRRRVAASLRAAHGPVAASGMEGDSIRAGPALRSPTGAPQAPAAVEVDQALRENGNASVTATGRHPRGGPMRADSRDPATPEFDRATAPTRDPTGSHRRIMPPMAVHGATGLQRKALAGTARRQGYRSSPSSGRSVSPELLGSAWWRIFRAEIVLSSEPELFGSAVVFGPRVSGGGGSSAPRSYSAPSQSYSAPRSSSGPRVSGGGSGSSGGRASGNSGFLRDDVQGRRRTPPVIMPVIQEA